MVQTAPALDPPIAAECPARNWMTLQKRLIYLLVSHVVDAISSRHLQECELEALVADIPRKNDCCRLTKPVY